VKRIEVNSSHVAYMAHPKETVKLIEETATSHTSISNHQLKLKEKSHERAD